MKTEPNPELELYRATWPGMPEQQAGKNWGAFQVGHIRIISSGTPDPMEPGWPWEHVSVSCRDRCPTWEEMDRVKNLFWRDDEIVVQFHVPKAQKVNRHPYCLHLWRDVTAKVTIPNGALVG